MSATLEYVDQQVVLFFRVYREINLPLYSTLVQKICASPTVPLEFATVLEDIGQVFMRLSDEINRELLKRGVLGDESDADETVEARTEIIVDNVLYSMAGRSDPMTDPAGEPIELEAFRQTLKVAVAMAHGLPVARTVTTGSNQGVLEM